MDNFVCANSTLAIPLKPASHHAVTQNQQEKQISATTESRHANMLQICFGRTKTIQIRKPIVSWPNS
jgi:hypothetical protein